MFPDGDFHLLSVHACAGIEEANTPDTIRTATKRRFIVPFPFLPRPSQPSSSIRYLDEGGLETLKELPVCRPDHTREAI